MSPRGDKRGQEGQGGPMKRKRSWDQHLSNGETRRWTIHGDHRWTYDPDSRTYMKEWSKWYYDLWWDDEFGMEYPIIWQCHIVLETADGYRWQERWTWDYVSS